MNQNRRNVVLILLMAFLVSFCCACNAVTPGPSTTRSIEAPVVVTTAMEETPVVIVTTAAPTTTPPATTEEETTEEETTEEEGEFLYATTNVNVRDAPGKKGHVIGSLKEGERVKKVGEDGKWTIVEFNGNNCYVYTEYLSEEKPQQ